MSYCTFYRRNKMISVNGEKIELKYYNDNSLNIKSISQKYGVIIITWHYESDAELFAVACLTRKYQALGFDVNLYLPYVPNARMDRVQNPDDIFTLKYFCEIINNLHFRNVYVFDTHSFITEGLLNNVIVFMPDKFMNRVIDYIGDKYPEDEDNLYLFYPDEGAMKRYKQFATVPYVFGVKERDWETRKIQHYNICGLSSFEVEGKSFIIQDDICATGCTIYQAAKRLKELGANHIYVFTTHTENHTLFNGEFGEEKVCLLGSGLIEKMFTTNSIFDKKQHIQTLLIDEKMVIFDIGFSTMFSLVENNKNNTNKTDENK